MTNDKQETINISLSQFIGGGRFIWHPCYGSEQYGQQYCCLNIIVGIPHHGVCCSHSHSFGYTQEQGLQDKR